MEGNNKRKLDSIHDHEVGKASDIQGMLSAVAEELRTLANQPASNKETQEDAIQQSNNDHRAAQIAILNIRSFFVNNARRGNQSADVQQIFDTLSGVIMSPQMVDERLGSAVERLFGMSRAQQRHGIQLHEQRSRNEGPGIVLKRQPHSFGAKALLDLEFVYDWFHNDCPLVEVDKSRRGTYQNRKCRCAGKDRRLFCHRRIRNGTKKQLAASFLGSDVYSDWRKRNANREIPLKTAQSCICFCIKEAKLNECACMMCVQFRYLLKAWDKQRKDWHIAPCRCTGCRSDKYAAFMEASSSSAAFKQIVLCPQKPYPHLTLPHLPNEVPHFYPLACCKKSGRFPSHVESCQECGWDKRLYNVHNCVERSLAPASWCKWQQTETGSSGSRLVFRKYTGTRRELTNEIITTYSAFVYHSWINAVTKQQAKLNVQTFDGKTEIIAQGDFAATTEMKAKHVATCEYPTTCQQCVVLVLHSPGKVTVGEERPVVTDYWRAWSNAKPSAKFHQKVMEKITLHYKKIIPGLKIVKILTDGCRHQYKGRFNWWEMATCHLRIPGIVQWHDFPASHHFPGPHDSAGKVPRAEMEQAEKFEQDRVYDYHCCYEFCMKYMAAPSAERAHKGTWGCNGQHFWLAFSNGEDMYKGKYEHIKPPGQDVTPIKGSNELYSFRAVGVASGVNSSARATITSKFMQCYCRACQGPQPQSCPSHVEFGGGYTATELRPVARAGRRQTRAVVEEDTACARCDGTGDPGKMLLCDTCDAGWHTSCLPEPLSKIPDGDWFCPDCNVDVREVEVDGGDGAS